LRLHREQRLTAAIESYREAVKLDPAYFEAHYNLALAAYEIRDLDHALAACEQALALDPDSTDARYNFALALDRGGYSRDAANELERLLAARSGEAKAHFVLAKIYGEKLAQIDSAREHYRRVLLLNPGHPEASAIRYWLAAHP
jgi:tetratricopeptide (TPR) repeat protein